MSSNLDKMFRCDLGRVSFRTYFKKLLTKVIVEEEAFSGKRPFGNSGWFYELAAGLVKHKLIPGTQDDPDLAKAEAVLVTMVAEMAGETAK